MQKIFIYVDDSGVLHSNAKNKYFVYAGYSFIGSDIKDAAKRRYIGMLKTIKKAIGVQGEVKASRLIPKYKAKLYRTMSRENSFAVSVKIHNLKDSILNNKNSIHRYKDYALKRVIKEQIKSYIGEGKINPDEPVKIILELDEQATATNGVYNLKESIYEELVVGIHNFDYGIFYGPILEQLEIDVHFCDSSCDYLIQACDILANRIWTSYIDTNKKHLRKLRNHIWLHLP